MNLVTTQLAKLVITFFLFFWLTQVAVAETITHEGVTYTVVEGSTLSGDYHENIAITSQPNDVLVDNVVNVDGSILYSSTSSLTITGGELHVTGDLLQTAGELHVIEGLLSVKGNFNIEDTARSFYMSDAGSIVTIEGDFNAGDVSLIFSAGEISLEGDVVVQRATMRNSPEHKIVLAGTGEQFIEFRSSVSFGGDAGQLHITNQSGELQFSSGSVPSGSWTYEGDTLSLNSFNPFISNDFTLNQNIEVQLTNSSASISIGSAQLNLNGYQLNIDGDLSINTNWSDSAYIQGGELLVSGDLEIRSGYAGLVMQSGRVLVAGNVKQTKGKLIIEGGDLVIDGDHQITVPSSDYSYQTDMNRQVYLQMYNPEGRIVVGGDFEISGRGGSVSLTAGEMVLRGDLTTLGDGIDTPSFYASGEHTTILAGNDKQVVNIDGSFGNLDITNQSGELYLDQVPGGNWTYAGETLKPKSFNLNRLYDVLSLNHDIEIVSSDNNKPNISGSLVLNGHTISVDGDAIISNAAIEGGVFSVSGDLLVTGLLRTLNSTTYESRSMSINGDGQLLVDGDVIQTGSILSISGNGKLSVGGDYRIQTPDTTTATGYQSSTGYLKMTSSEAELVVSGNFFIDSSYTDFRGNSLDSTFTEGTMTLKGDLIVISDNVASGSEFKIILSGTSGQQVNFSNNKTPYLGQLHITNHNYVHDLNPLPPNGWTSEGDISKLKSFNYFSDGTSLYRSFTLNHDIEVELEGDDVVEIVPSNKLFLNGHSLKVSGDLIQSGGEIDIDGGELIVGGDYRIQTPSSDISGYSVSFGLLKMQDAEDQVTVDGDFVMDSRYDHTDYLTAGEMSLKGDFTQLKTYTGSNSNAASANFAAGPSHKVILAGSGDQNISFATRPDSHFGQLQIANQIGALDFDTIPAELWTYEGELLTLKSLNGLGDVYTLEHDINIELASGEQVELDGTRLVLNGHKLSINGDLNLLAGLVDLQGSSLDISGDLIQSGAGLVIGSGQLVVNGDYRIQKLSTSSISGYISSSGYLSMQDDAGRLTIEGDFVTESQHNHSEYLTAGEMTVKGDFTQINSSYSNFAASQTHKVILAGSGEQQVSFEGPLQSHFNKLHIENQSGEVDLGVISPGELTYAGDVLKLKSFEFVDGTLSLTHDIEVELTGIEIAEISDGKLSLNGHKLTIDGDLTLSDGILFVDGGKLEVTGGVIQSGTDVVLGSGEFNVGGDYRIQRLSDSSYTGYSASSGILIMQDAAGKMFIEGDFVTQSQKSHSGYLTGGEMTLKGDFSQVQSSSQNFAASEDHKVILAGDVEQSIDFDNPSSSHFASLTLTNSSEASTHFSSQVVVTSLFEHNRKPFELYSDLETNFIDYDGDGVRDHLDPAPQNAAIASYDADSDGVTDNEDAFPEDASEWADSDLDGTGDNADTDDDNDGMPDKWELANNLDPLDAGDAGADADGDNVINLDEYRASSDPQSQDSDGDGIADDLDQVVGSGLWGYACNVVNDPNSSSRRWGINQYNMIDLPSATAAPVYSMGKNRTIQSVACDLTGENILFSMKDSVRGDYEIYELEVASGLVSQITDNDTDDVDVTRSRDGRTVAWQMRLPDGRQAIELSRYQASGELIRTTLASATPFVQPSLSANGKWLTFVQLRPSSFAVMRYDILNAAYKEVRVIARRKKLYHPSITDDGNKVGWSERTSMLRYRVKDLAEDTTTDIVYNVNGVEHAVLSGDGKHVIYSINTPSFGEGYLTALDTLVTETIGETQTSPIRYLSSNWGGVTATTRFTTAQLSGKQLVSYEQNISFSFNTGGTGTRYSIGENDAVDFHWNLDNGSIVMVDANTQEAWFVRLLATTSDNSQYTASIVKPDNSGGVVRLIDTLYSE